jgi:UDP-N-acetylmuramate dehydrogenase
LKGTRVGDAEISMRHANFIVNRGQARASDILTLINLAQEKVSKKFGVHLELEIEVVGNNNKT